MLSEHRDYHGGIFRALALVNGRRVGWHQHIEFAKAITDRAAIESHSNLTNLGINAIDGANVAVVNLFVVVVLDLHHLITGCKGPAESLNFFVARGIKRRL